MRRFSCTTIPAPFLSTGIFGRHERTPSISPRRPAHDGSRRTPVPAGSAVLARPPGPRRTSAPAHHEPPLPARRPEGAREGTRVLLLLAFLIVLLFFGLGFALHFLWIVAVIFFVLWLVGYAIGRGESAGRHRFYRW